VATAEKDRLNISPSKPHTSFAAASDCRTVAIYEYTPGVEKADPLVCSRSNDARKRLFL
jgi:hypothetical protein